MSTFLDSFGDFVSAIGEKTSGSIEVTKLSFYVSEQEKKLAEAQKKMGEYYFTKLLMEEETVDEAILEYFEQAKDAQERIAGAKIRIKELEEIVNAPITPGKKTCGVCGEVVYSAANYCPECGAAFTEDVEVEVEEAEAEEAKPEDAADENHAAKETVEEIQTTADEGQANTEAE